MARRKSSKGKLSKTKFLRIPTQLARNTSPQATRIKKKLFGATRAKKQTEAAIKKFGAIKRSPPSLKTLI
ncbi:hypothetical protein LCGC14_0943490 [marine sediment metagenome]|uniref:Uncharacterized protein n=1 Tax=marine sediment metagenome TaxID=412755 RepID=A0A0F9P5F4_9ZZZZ